MEDNRIQFKVRDKRNKGWFFVDNEYLNGYGKKLGAIGISIYIVLCRHADGEQKCFPSEKTIGKELRLTDRTVRKYIKLFEKYHLIETTKERSREGKWLNNTYWLLDKTEWIEPKEVVSDSQSIGNKTQNQRKLITEPKETNNSLTIPIKKNTNKKNTNFSYLKKKPYFWDMPMWKNKNGKWLVIHGQNDFRKFAGKESDIEWR